MTTYLDFSANYLVKDGMPITDTVLNKPTDQLKKEIIELQAEIDILNNSLTSIGTLSEFISELN